MKKKPQTDIFNKALDDLEKLQNDFTKAVALAVYIVKIPDMLEIIDKSKTSHEQKTLMVCALFCQIPTETLVKILEKLWNKKKVGENARPVLRS